jgi:hypothetical protein
MSRARFLFALGGRSPLFVLCTWLVALVAGCSDSSSPVTPDPHSPPAIQLGLTVAVDAAGSAVALPGISDVRATATAPLAAIASYSVNYGDGFQTTDASSSHVYQTAGTYTIGSGSPFHASLMSDQSIRITFDDGTVDMSGTADGTRMRLTVRGGAEDGRTMDFVPYDPY